MDEAAHVEVGSVNAELAELQSTDDLAMTPIETWDEEIVAEVPTEVANAVKRAIAALERITGEVPVVAPIKQPSEFEEPDAPTPVVAAAPAFGGFAPPSLDMSAEAIYARVTAQMEAEIAGTTLPLIRSASTTRSGKQCRRPDGCRRSIRNDQHGRTCRADRRSRFGGVRR